MDPALFPAFMPTIEEIMRKHFPDHEHCFRCVVEKHATGRLLPEARLNYDAQLLTLHIELSCGLRADIGLEMLL